MNYYITLCIFALLSFFIHVSSYIIPSATLKPFLKIKQVLNMKLNELLDMSVDEIKSELDLRRIDFSDCVSKSQLQQRLNENRSKGTANPDIFDKFNNKPDVQPELFEDFDVISQMVSNDGNLPGGLSPLVLKALASDREIMSMLRDPKMQEVMKAVMINGASGIKKYLSDPG